MYRYGDYAKGSVSVQAATTPCRRGVVLAVLALLAWLAPSTCPAGAEEFSSAGSYHQFCRAQQNIGAVTLDVTNYGSLGHSRVELWPATYNCFPDLPLKPLSYPTDSHGIYRLFGGIWIGAVVGADTLVSTGTEQRDWYSEMTGVSMRYWSTLRGSPGYNSMARSEQDFVAVYTDTVAVSTDLDPLDHRPHKPLNVEITQISSAWSYAYAEDFILFDLSIRNIGDEHLSAVYVGLYGEGDVFQWPVALPACTGCDVEGFLSDHPVEYHGCEYDETVDLAWYANYSGRLDASLPVEPVPHIAGLRLVDAHEAHPLTISYNWWAPNSDPEWDFGPQMRSRIHDSFTAGRGEPHGDRIKYHYLRNGEIDYDPAYTPLIQPGDPLWLYPNQNVVPRMPQYIDKRFLLSFGPFEISPGESVPAVFAFVMGKHFHVDPTNHENIGPIGDGYDPDAYYENVDFRDIVKNSIWASWVYDNPGYDTDGDGYAGEYHLCCKDSAIVSIDTTVVPNDTIWERSLCRKIWYKGDGVPDWRPATPPPAPKVWVEPEVGRVRIRWNGTLSETTEDIFMQIPDFEGYRVYYSLDSRESSFRMLTSYDKHNYDKYIWNRGWREWEVLDNPFTLEELTCLYGNSCDDPNFDPLLYSRSNPYHLPGFPDSMIYFTDHDFNRSEFGLTTAITKTYPEQPYPTSIIPDSAEAWELTEDGYLKYFEYEYMVENLLPTVPYYFNVTAFDFGSPESGVDVLETAKHLNPLYTYPMPDVSVVERDDLRVYVYPNPYRIDGGYLEQGYEGRDARWPIRERCRLVHFANLPAKCWIRIFSLDGDLIRELRHDRDPIDPDASHDTWDMITRNTQRLVSGIYYWTVEPDVGETQIGKLVVIK